MTEDEVEIHGDYAPPRSGRDEKAPAAILLHMYKQDRTTYAPLIPHLHKAGFAVLAIDMRGHGESTGPPEAELAERVEKRDSRLFGVMDRDVGAAYLWLAGQPEADLTRFVLVGASVGCSVALEYAARDRSVDGVVCMTPGTKYLGIDSVRHAKKYGERPVLLLASEAERRAVDELAKHLPEATVEIAGSGTQAPPDDPTALHGTRMFGRVPGIEQTITEFLLKAAGGETAEPVVASIKSNVYHVPDSGFARMIKDENRRWFSSAEEAAGRGLRPPKSGKPK
jgi:pimeloyl-ACP methyl ester carboxylesterase